MMPCLRHSRLSWPSVVIGRPSFVPIMTLCLSVIPPDPKLTDPFIPINLPITAVLHQLNDLPQSSSSHLPSYFGLECSTSSFAGLFIRSPITCGSLSGRSGSRRERNRRGRKDKKPRHIDKPVSPSCIMAHVVHANTTGEELSRRFQG